MIAMIEAITGTAVAHDTGKVLASVFGGRKDEAFVQRTTLLAPCGLPRYDTAYWGAYPRHLDPNVQSPGQRHTQPMERQHLTIRRRMPHLVRQTSCFSQTPQRHDLVMGVFVNRYALGRVV